MPVEGLPEDAVVKPMGTPAAVNGLPEGAVVKPLGGRVPQYVKDAASSGQANPVSGSNALAGIPGAVAGVAKGFGKDLVQPAAQAMETMAKRGMAMPSTLGPGYEVPPEAVPDSFAQQFDPHGAAEHVGAGVSQMLQFVGGDEALKGMSLAEKARHVSAIANFLEKYPKLASALGVGLRQGAVGTAQGAAHGDTPGQAAMHGAENAAGYWFLKGGGKALKAAFGKVKPATMSEAVEGLTSALNPAAEHMPKFRADLESQLPRVVDYAERQGVDLSKGGRKALLDTMGKAADEYQGFYDKQILEPLKDRLAPSGKTYGELESELRHLNRTTNYSPTTAAESEAMVARKARANQIRTDLNQGMAKELKLTPEQIEDARSAGQQLRDLHDKGQLAWDIERHAHNAQERGSVSIHANGQGSIPGTPVSGGRVTSAYTEATNKVLGHPADNKTNDIFRRLHVERYEDPRPELQPSHTSTRTPVADRVQTPMAVAHGPANAASLQPDHAAARKVAAARTAERTGTRSASEARANAKADANKARHGRAWQAAEKAVGTGE